MTDDIRTLAKVIMSAPALLKEIYGDLAKPGVRQVGKALETVLGFGNTILLPLALLNKQAAAAEKNFEKFRVNLSSTPPDKVINVPMEIGVPIIEKLMYVTNDELSDLYVSLLSRASVDDYAHQAHPSFANIINNLSPDEAVLIGSFKPTMPFIELCRENHGSGYRTIVVPLLTGLETKCQLSFPQNIALYMSNLRTLGLVDILEAVVRPDSLYLDLEDLYRSQVSESTRDEGNAVYSLRRGAISVTPIGRLFISACLGHDLSDEVEVAPLFWR